MRSLFVLLLVMNVSYLIWGVAFSEKEIRDFYDLKPGLNTLTLLTEKPEEMIPRRDTETTSNENLSTPNSESNIEGVQPRACFSLGPFFKKDRLKTLEAKLKQAGFKVKSKPITDTEPKSYWVYLPAAKTMQDAEKAAAKLKAANAKDYFIIRAGKNVKAISLGLYNNYDRANYRKEELAELGIKAKVKTRYQKVTRHWLDYQQTQSKPLNDKVWKQSNNDIVLQKVARPCVDPLPETG